MGKTASTSNQNRMLHVVLHTLLEHGQGLTLGPDCDGLLNFMDDDLPDLVSRDNSEVREQKPANLQERNFPVDMNEMHCMLNALPGAYHGLPISQIILSCQSNKMYCTAL